VRGPTVIAAGHPCVVPKREEKVRIVPVAPEEAAHASELVLPRPPPALTRENAPTVPANLIGDGVGSVPTLARQAPDLSATRNGYPARPN
jgi:hypothetical protein